jgi:hypothetical protein
MFCFQQVLDEQYLIVKGNLFCEKHLMRLKVQRSGVQGSAQPLAASAAMPKWPV